MKKFLLVFILVFSLSFFCGCSRAQTPQIKDDFVVLGLENFSNGRMVQSLRFSCNGKRFDEKNAPLKEKLEFRQNLVDMISEIRNQFLFSFALTYVQNPNDEYKINSGVILSPATYDEKNDSVGFNIIFTSLGAWNYYHKSGEEQEVKAENTCGNIFYRKVVSNGENPYLSVNSSGDSAMEIYKAKYLSALKGLSIEEEVKSEYAPQFIYNYATPQQAVKSNSDLMYRGREGLYHHVWIVEEGDKAEDNKITLSITYVFKAWWIFFALLIILSVCLISIIIVKIKDTKLIKKPR